MVSLTLKQISQRLELLAKSHQQINTVFVGNIGDFEAANKGNLYPACVIELKQTFNPDLATRKATYNFTIGFFDLLDLADNSRNNELELKSDLASISLDFLAMINDYPYLQDWQVPETLSGRIGEFKLNDVCVGVYFDLPISAFYDGNRCQVQQENRKYLISLLITLLNK
jgi:hypothetical protein